MTRLMYNMDVNGEYVEEQMEGFKARAFMHEIDRLGGLIISSYTVILVR